MSLTEYILLIVGTILLLYFIIYYIDYKRKIKLKEKHQMFWIRRVVKKGTHKLKEILILIPLKKTIYISLGLILIIIIGLSFFQKSTINNYIEAKPLYNSYENFRTNDEVISYSNLMASDYLNLTQIQDDQVFLVENYNGNKIDEYDPLYGEMVLEYHEYINDLSLISILDDNQNISFNVGTIDEGLYNLMIDYYEINNLIDTNQIEILINGQSPFYEARTIILPSKWAFEDDD
ncbi:MAG: hypothetical protein WC907_07635, partial [Acholeplasmataceae bacterium]